MSIARFWRETPRRYNLGGSKCTNCGTVYFPPRAVCPACTHHRQSIEKMIPFPLTGDGEVFSYTVVHDAAEGFEMQVPYVMALVKTHEGPILTGQIVDVEPGDVAIGLPVRATFRKLREEGKAGVIHYGYKFSPVEDPDDGPPNRGQEAPVSTDAPSRDRAPA
ncbi:MAG: Zn-ribbon domain-containing OB-fold protein [Thermoplasmata archaeon]